MKGSCISARSRTCTQPDRGPLDGLPDDRPAGGGRVGVRGVDIGVSGGRAVPVETRRQRVDAEAGRLAGLGALLAGVLNTEGLDHYAVAMKDPEGNEFDIN